MDKENQPQNQAWGRRAATWGRRAATWGRRAATWGRRLGIGILTSISLHNTIYVVASLVLGFRETYYGHPVVIGVSGFWLLLWFGVFSVVFWVCKPRLLEWAIPFTLIVGLWFYGMFGANWHPDNYEEEEIADFSVAMFVACFCVWGLALLLAVVKWMLATLRVRNKPQ